MIILPSCLIFVPFLKIEFPNRFLIRQTLKIFFGENENLKSERPIMKGLKYSNILFFYNMPEHEPEFRIL